MSVRNSKKGQAAIEYLSIVALSMLIIIPAIAIFLSFTSNNTEEVTANQINLLGSSIMTKAEEMYVIGKGSWVTMEVNVPADFQNAGINENQDLYLNYSSSIEDSQAIFFSTRFEINNGEDDCFVHCNLPLVAGLNRIRIE